MKLVIVAATGGIGRELLSQAIAAGHEVTAAVRNPAGLPEGVTSVAVDLSAADPEGLASALAGADAVLSGLGPRANADVGVVEAGTRAIATAMSVADVRRLVVVSAGPIGTVASPRRPNPPKHDPGDGFLVRYALAPLVKAALRSRYADLARMEDVLAESRLDWTAVRPPRLTNGPHTGTYRTEVDRNVRGGTTISRADVADAMLRALDRQDVVGHTLGLGY